jgi:hypothetical protein
MGKKRSLETILSKILEIKKIRARFFKDKWDPWFNSCLPLKQIWGEESLLSGSRKVVFDFDERGHSCSPADCLPLNIQVLVAEENELPLMITDPYWKKALPIIEKRFKGLIKPILKRQDLVDMHRAYEIRDRHIYTTLNSYKNLLYKILYNEYQDKIYNRYSPLELITVKHNNHSFFIKINSSGDLKLLDDSEVVKEKNVQAISSGT